MEYRELVDWYEELEATSSTLELTEILADGFQAADAELLPSLVLLCRGNIFADWEPAELGVSSSLTTEAITKATGITEDQLEDWWRDTGDLGNAAVKAVDARKQATLMTETLTVTEVHETLQEIATYEGEGSQQQRVDAIANLLSNSDPKEARYIVRTVLGAMRLGVGEGLLRDAIAAAFLDGSEAAVDAVERAHQVTNDFRVVARTAKTDGIAGLEALDIELFRPIKVMLAQKAERLEEGIADTASDRSRVLLEYKYDGMRTQIHHDGDRTEVYTRRLENVTDQFPAVAEHAATQVDADSFIIEGEIVGYDPETGAPVPFQTLSQRIKRKYDIEQLQAEIPVTVHLFDILYLDGASLLDEPLNSRLAALEERLEPAGESVLERAATRRSPDLDTAASFYETALSAGHEGLMLKNLDAAYQPGSRVGYMMKLKPTMEPLDLVITRAKWSEGRRSDFLGRVYLGCRDEASGEFVEVGRMATGFTDAELEEITNRLKPLITEEDGRSVSVDPGVIVEAEYEEIQESPDYDSGYALRFPRFRKFRDDLTLEDIDSLARVRKLYDSQA